MKIQLVNPPDFDFTDTYYGKEQPLGLAYIAAVLLEHGCNDVGILDANLHNMRTKDIISEILRLTRGETSVVGFSTYISNFRKTVAIIRGLKRRSPDLFIVLGGHHATPLHDLIMQRVLEVDSIILGEGEFPMLELVNALDAHSDLAEIPGLLWRSGRSVRKNRMRPLIQDINSLPFPARHLLPSLYEYSSVSGFPDIRANLVASRGCPFVCSFCDIQTFYRTFEGKLWRPIAPSRVVDEIELVMGQGAETVLIEDDIFMLDPRHAKAIAEEIIARNLGIQWHFETRADLLVRQRQLLPLFKESGCKSIFMGVESGSQAQLNRYKKGTTVLENKDALRIIRDNGLAPTMGFIMFDPSVGISDLRENLEFVREQGASHYTLFTYEVILPNTEVYRKLVAEGKIRPDIYATDCLKVNPDTYFSDSKARQVFVIFDGWVREQKPYFREIISLDRDIGLLLRLLKLKPNLAHKSMINSTIARVSLAKAVIRGIFFDLFAKLLDFAEKEDGKSESRLMAFKASASMAVELEAIKVEHKMLQKFKDEARLLFNSPIESSSRKMPRPLAMVT